MALSLRWRLSAVAVVVACASAAAGFGQSTNPPFVDLTAAFHTKSPWKLIVSQGPPTEDVVGNPAPGSIDLCLRKANPGPCDAKPVAPPPTEETPVNWGPHYLKIAKPVYPRDRSAAPLLQLVTASLSGGDGDQVIVTQLLKYDRSRDVFERVYFHVTGRNNNQEVRFIADGPLKGSVISAQPTADAPYGYWIAVNRPTPANTYQQVLRYRSATRYNDGNALAVIDSEMPNIEQRLGLWKPGSPLPLPARAKTPCPKPRLDRMELWCA